MLLALPPLDGPSQQIFVHEMGRGPSGLNLSDAAAVRQACHMRQHRVLPRLEVVRLSVELEPRNAHWLSLAIVEHSVLEMLKLNLVGQMLVYLFS